MQCPGFWFLRCINVQCRSALFRDSHLQSLRPQAMGGWSPHQHANSTAAPKRSSFSGTQRMHDQELWPYVSSMVRGKRAHSAWQNIDRRGLRRTNQMPWVRSTNSSTRWCWHRNGKIRESSDHRGTFRKIIITFEHGFRVCCQIMWLPCWPKIQSVWHHQPSFNEAEAHPSSQGDPPFHNVMLPGGPRFKWLSPGGTDDFLTQGLWTWKLLPYVSWSPWPLPASLASGEMPTPWLTYTLSSGTIQSFELQEKLPLSWVFRAKETLKVEGMIEGKENLDRKLDNSLWRMRLVSAAGGT